MNRSEQERTRIVRTWLDEGSTQLSPRVHDAVLREFPSITQDGASGSWRMRMTAYATVAVAAAAMVLAVLAGPRLLPGTVPGGAAPTAMPSPTQESPPTPQPIDRSYRDVGFIGLPPLGAEPSGPDNAVLVENFWLPPQGGPLERYPYRGQAFLYADGRLIWIEYFDSGSTGFLEQRLTSSGVELVQALAIQPFDDQPRKLDPARLPSLLPDGAWADERVRPYVPSGFAACLSVQDVDSAFGGPGSNRAISESLSEVLPMLPIDVTDLLRDRRPITSTHGYGERGAPHDCRGMTVADARWLDAALREADLERDEWRNRYLLEYHVDLDGDGPEYWWLNIWFEPVLPDGTITCSSCG
jgi:hypothetical protein